MSFINKGNKDQYEHNKDVMDKLEEATELLAEKNIEEAKKTLENGKKMLKFRMKCIRIADREGWTTVRHFVNDELVSDENREKRLKRETRCLETMSPNVVIGSMQLIIRIQRSSS